RRGQHQIYLITNNQLGGVSLSNQLYTTHLITTTNSHWVTVNTAASDRQCNVLGCKADHSEKRTEELLRWRVTECEIVFEGAKNRVVLQIEPLPKKFGPGFQRTLYSGWDYEREKPRTWTWQATNTWPPQGWITLTNITSP